MRGCFIPGQFDDMGCLRELKPSCKRRVPRRTPVMNDNKPRIAGIKDTVFQALCGTAPEPLDEERRSELAEMAQDAVTSVSAQGRLTNEAWTEAAIRYCVARLRREAEHSFAEADALAAEGQPGAC